MRRPLRVEPFRCWSALLVVVGIAGCEDHAGDVPPTLPATASVIGVVTRPGGLPLPGTVVWIRVFDGTFDRVLRETTVTTDVAGGFTTTFSLDTLALTAPVTVHIRPAFGSGLGTEYVTDSTLAFSRSRPDTLRLDVRLQLQAPPVSAGPPAPLQPADLLGDYAGQTVPPPADFVEARLDLSVTSVTDSVVGRYHLRYNATVTCGTGYGSILGRVDGDTLRLTLTSDPVVPGIPAIVTQLLAVTPAAGADTLVVVYPPSPQGCTAGAPAPMRLVRR